MSRADEPRINRDIIASSIRLIDASGNMVGVVSVQEGIKLAERSGLDLVEISPNASPPVCKVLDYGKYRYEAQKRAHEARKKQKTIVVKEIKLRPMIDKHDLEIKMRNAISFLNDGDKVKITLRFRGREASHSELGMKVINQVQEMLAEHSKVEQSPRIEGRQISMMVIPNK
ncbi:MAG: translation initiation factor IF-3 [Rickettsiales bacterium]